MRRGQAIVLTTALVAVAAVLLVVFVIQLSSSSDPEQTRIGDETFELGDAERLATRTPFLFQDLRGNDLDVWVHHTGTDPKAGWVTFLAHTGDRRCAVQWQPTSRTFKDCRGKTYTEDGAALPHYATSVDEKGKVVVDFTQ
jgi:hypothetical protein